MTQDTRIKKWSNLLLDKLLEYREANPGFTFAVRQGNRYQRLEKGYWFQGDENYIFVGFTSGGDESNKTRSIGLVFTNIQDEEADCCIEIVFKAEPLKDLEHLYRDFIATHPGFETIDHAYYKDFKYFKRYPTSDPVKNLERFLNEEWKDLSEEVKKRGLKDVFFVPEKDFSYRLNRIKEVREQPNSQILVEEPEPVYDTLLEPLQTGETGQLNIPVLIGEQEFRLSLQEEEHPSASNRLWRGKVSGYSPTIWVQFIEVNGTVSNLEHSEQLNLIRDILFERLNNALRGLREVELEGVEPTETEEILEHEHNLIQTPYNPEEIKVKTAHFPIFLVFDMINKQDIDLNPDFQRHFVWNMQQKSRLIESILIGIPLPVFYFSQDYDGVFYVVDGLQRLATIWDFMNNKFYLRNLEHLKICEGNYFSTDLGISKNKALERRFQRRIEQTQLIVYIIESSSPPLVKYDIFKRINEGGKPFNQQEIRNSLAKPHARKLLRDLAYSDEFIKATGGDSIKKEPGVSDQRMGAQELVLRFVGFYFWKKGTATYQGDMNNFLDDTLDKLNALQERDTLVIGEQFLQAMTNCYHLFGKYCFRKCLLPHLKPNAPKQLINKSLFTTWSVSTGNLSSDRVKKIPFEAFSEVLAKELEQNEDYYSAVSYKTNDRQYLEKAFEITEKLIKENL
jgi:hypothetical protein